MVQRPVPRHAVDRERWCPVSGLEEFLGEKGRDTQGGTSLVGVIDYSDDR